MNWIDKLGVFFLKRGALTYVVDDDEDWDIKFSKIPKRQQIDMVVFNKDSVQFIELKETDSVKMKKCGFKQIERYHYLCRDVRYNVEFWVFIYWKKYNVITGIKMPFIENLQVYAINNGKQEFYASIGVNPEKRIRKKVDVVIEV